MLAESPCCFQVTRLAADFDELFLHRHDEESRNMKGHRDHRSHNRHSDKRKVHGRHVSRRRRERRRKRK